MDNGGAQIIEYAVYRDDGNGGVFNKISLDGYLKNYFIDSTNLVIGSFYRYYIKARAIHL